LIEAIVRRREKEEGRKGERKGDNHTNKNEIACSLSLTILKRCIE